MIKLFNRLYTKYIIWKNLRKMVSNKEIHKDFKIIFDESKQRYIIDVNPIAKPQKIDYIDEEEIIEEKEV